MLRRHLERVKVELPEQMEALAEFSSHQPERVPEWKAMVLAFELDNTKPNPFELKVKGMMLFLGRRRRTNQFSGLTEAQVRLQFSKEEDAEIARGVPSVHDVSPSSFVAAGLDLEEEQYVHAMAPDDLQ
jgi:hypothetical protein